MTLQTVLCLFSFLNYQPSTWTEETSHVPFRHAFQGCFLFESPSVMSIFNTLLWEKGIIHKFDFYFYLLAAQVALSLHATNPSAKMYKWRKAHHLKGAAAVCDLWLPQKKKCPNLPPIRLLQNVCRHFAFRQQYRNCREDLQMLIHSSSFTMLAVAARNSSSRIAGKPQIPSLLPSKKGYDKQAVWWQKLTHVCPQP